MSNGGLTIRRRRFSPASTCRLWREDFAVNLQLTSDKPAVVHGENGVSQKSAGLGRASHYFSLTRLQTRGSLRFGQQSYQVEGTSWMDHEFFTHSLE